MKRICNAAVVAFIAITLALSIAGLSGYLGSVKLTTQQQATLDKLIYGDNGAEYNENWTPVKDKAVIILHGLMDGAMYAPSEDGEISTEVVYAMGNIEGMSGGTEMLNNMVPLLTSDKECLPTIKTRIGNMQDSAPYDAAGLLKDVYTYFESGYSDSYDVLCWQYDWRQHLDNAALRLNSFIEKCNYDSVILIGHSMGTCVISRYLAIGEEQRNRVELFIPFGGPMLGSVDAAEFLSFNEPTAKVPKGGMMESMSVFFKLIDPDHVMAGSFTTLYHLMVSEAFLSTPYFAEGESCYKIDGKYVDTEEYLKFLQKFEWTKGEYDKELGKADTKVIIKTLSDFQSKVFKRGKHVSQLVKTEYVVGIGNKTTVCTEVNSDGYRVNRVASDLGDGLVPAYSATAGLPLENKNVHCIDGANHMEIVLEKNGVSKVLNDIMARHKAGISGTNA